MQRVKSFILAFKYELAYLALISVSAVLLVPRASDAMGLIIDPSGVRGRLFSRIVSAVFAQNTHSRAAVLFCFAFAAAAAVLVAVITGRIAKRCSDELDFAIFAAMFYASPLFVARIFYESFFFGSDAALFMLALFAVYAVRRGGNIAALTGITVVAEFIDERFIFAYFPCVLIAVLFELEGKKNIRSKASLLRSFYVSLAAAAVCFAVLTLLNRRAIQHDTAGSLILNVLITIFINSPLIVTFVLFWRGAASAGVLTRRQATAVGFIPLCAAVLIPLGTGCARAVFDVVMTQSVCAAYLLLTRKDTSGLVSKAVAFWRSRPLLTPLAIILEAAFILFTSKGESSKLFSFLQSDFLFY